MYTGTLIEELLRTVEQAEHNTQLTRAAEEKEWQNLFELRSAEQTEQIFAGAA
jgi:hypothetical protein